MIEVQKEVPDSLHHTCVVVTWATMPNGEVGKAIELANFADRSVQVVGTFGVGGNVRVQDGGICQRLHVDLQQRQLCHGRPIGCSASLEATDRAVR